MVDRLIFSESTLEDWTLVRLYPRYFYTLFTISMRYPYPNAPSKIREKSDCYPSQSLHPSPLPHCSVDDLLSLSDSALDTVSTEDI